MAEKKSLSDLGELTNPKAEAPAVSDAPASVDAAETPAEPAAAGAEHPHGGQNPELLDVASMNRKNKVGA